MRLLRALATLATAALAGYATTSTATDVKLTDRNTFVPAGRMVIDIAPRGFDAPSKPHTGHAIEAGISGASGEGRQDLTPGADPVTFGGRTFAAPNQLSHEFDFRYAEIAYRYRRLFGWGDFGIEALVGLGYAELDLTVASAAQRANEKLGTAGLVGGFGIIWKFLPTTSLQSRITVFGSGEIEDVTGAGRFDAYLVQALGEHVALRAGWTAWSVASTRKENDEEIFSPNSRIRARFSGFALGLDLMF